LRDFIELRANTSRIPALEPGAVPRFLRTFLRFCEVRKMPDKPKWTDQIADLIGMLRTWPSAVIGTTEVAKMFDVSQRTAQGILATAGATIETGKAAFIEPGELIRYLQIKGGAPVAMEERERRKRMGRTLVQFSTFHQAVYAACPKIDQIEIVPAENTPERQVFMAAGRAAAQKGVDALPKEIEILPGRISFYAENLYDASQLMLLFLLVAGKDLDTLALRMEPVPDPIPGLDLKNGDERPAPGNAQIARSLRGMLESSELALRGTA
jgi:hypothetical protein